MKKSTLVSWIMGVAIGGLLISNSYYRNLAADNQNKADKNYQTFKDAQIASSNKYTECISKLAGKIVIPTLPNESIVKNNQTILEKDDKISDYAAAYEGVRVKYNALVNTHNDLVTDNKKCVEGWEKCVSSGTTVSKNSNECDSDYNNLLDKYKASIESNKECVTGWNNKTKNFQDLSNLCKNMLQKNILQ